jgi:hypothetical protein
MFTEMYLPNIVGKKRERVLLFQQGLCHSTVINCQGIVKMDMDSGEA